VASAITELEVENIALSWLEELGYEVVWGPDIAPDGGAPERSDWAETILIGRLEATIQEINPTLPQQAIDEAMRKIKTIKSASLVIDNKAFHKALVEGISVEYLTKEGTIRTGSVKIIDFEHIEHNAFLAVNQFTVIENKIERRADIVLFINGFPVSVIELKNPADENATIWTAFNQLQTYKQQIPSLFTFNEALVISDGLDARIGTLTANKEWFMPWHAIEDEHPADKNLPQLQVLIKGVFDKKRFLDIIRHFIVFEDQGGGNYIKKMAGYHQYHAVNTALKETVRATGAQGDKRIGVIWHTQGSGKSLTMAFFSGKVILQPEMQNPTIVVITDRNDLDDQLFGTFSRCHELLRQKPQQAESRAHLRELLDTGSGGVIFTTVHKFFPTEEEYRHPLLSNRRNIVVIADEAHRSQYDFIDGYARSMREALPNASFIGFTGTPLELADKSTKAVFGDYISIYDIERAVEDEATVRIYYESRLAKLELDERERPSLDVQFEEVTEGEEIDRKERLKTKWAQLEALVGSEKRVKLIAKDIIKHYEDRISALEGKAMIVCMSRRICVDLYNAIAEIKPHWCHSDDEKGSLKIVMTGAASDPLDWQEHIRNKPKREVLAKRFKDPKDPFRIVIVRDMWLTGFDAPCLHTMYVDKPMRGHGLMQAIARVNRKFKDKPGGLIVDYLGLAHELKEALHVYTESGGTGETAIDIEEVVMVLKKYLEVCEGLFYGFNRADWYSHDAAKRFSILPAAQEHILAQPDGKRRLEDAVNALSKAYAQAGSHEAVLEAADDVRFFQTVKAAISKSAEVDRKSPEELDHAIRQILSRAVVSDEVIDIFKAAGLKKPDISVLSDEFLAEVRGLPHKNLAVEMLKKLLLGEIKKKGKRNIVQARSFAEMLEEAMRRYQNRAIETVQIIEELIGLAKEIREADQRGDSLGLTEDEVAFYDALSVNDSAVRVLGDDKLKLIAQELLKSVRSNLTIDWTIRENVKADIRARVRRILNKYGYPPDKQEKATQLVLEQAEVICNDLE